MTRQEHDLIVMMFTTQTLRIRALMDVLETRGTINKEDFQNQEQVVFQNMGTSLHEFVKTEYQRFAQQLGMLETCSPLASSSSQRTN